VVAALHHYQVVFNKHVLSRDSATAIAFEGSLSRATPRASRLTDQVSRFHFNVANTIRGAFAEVIDPGVPGACAGCETLGLEELKRGGIELLVLCCEACCGAEVLPQDREDGEGQEGESSRCLSALHFGAFAVSLEAGV
jgi:hypothetical protein